MGVPAFFRWLSRKYPSIVVHCVEEKGKEINGVKIPVDSSKPNPNDYEFDNLYLDMNGIIHPCCHPEDKPAPKNEDEMMVAIFEYIDRLFSIVRPRKLLYMAIDGVAPRAKMNQQRSRRFRASKETEEKVTEIARIRDELLSKGASLPPQKPKEEHFDSNCITPGTPFMDRLAKCLHYYIHDRLNNDPGWRNITVILSDANVPGEGEHKIMDYIRRQRANPDHDPNTHHCLCGADADLIMLGLATHEPNFTIIREEFKPNQPRPCEVCGQLGHEMKDCTGAPKDCAEAEKPLALEVQFIFLRLNILREYLEKELVMYNLPFEFEMERALDDWVFMCFFVGNDFLPHLPSLEIREGAIDRLINLYKKAVHKTGGYLTDSGMVNLHRVQLIMTDLGEVEDEIFKRRQENEKAFKQRQKDKKKRMKMMNDKPAWIPGGQFKPTALGSQPSPVVNARQEAYQMRMQGLHSESNSGGSSNNKTEKSEDDGRKGLKRKSDEAFKNDSDEEEEPHDEVRLWEDGWKDRYYECKFDVSSDNLEFRRKVAEEYTKGLCWVLRYYYQGCASWKWYFPYHYAPFASDFINIGDLSTEFEKHTQPFKPLEQLMGVFPAASKQHLPEPWGYLMFDASSPIIDFYPEDFKIDLNGKKYAWQGVALLPFVDEKRLLKALETVYPLITEEERKRNIRGDDRLYVGKHNEGFNFLCALYEGKVDLTKEMDLDTKLFKGIGGKLLLSDAVVEPGGVLKSPVPCLSTLQDNQAICVRFRDPKYEEDYIFPAKRLPGAIEPEKVLKPSDLNAHQSRSWRPQIGMSRSNQRAYLDGSGHRQLSHAGGYAGRGTYSNMPPPRSLTYDSSRSSGRQGWQREGGGNYQQQDNYSRNRYGGGGGGGGGGWRDRKTYSDSSSYQRPSGYSQDSGRGRSSRWSDSYSSSSRPGFGYNSGRDSSNQDDNNDGESAGTWRTGHYDSNNSRDSYGSRYYSQQYSSQQQQQYRRY